MSGTRLGPQAPFGRFDLGGKVALVTGGSRGLGREMVHAFAQAGADVVIVSRNLDRCEAVAAEVRESTGRRAFAYGCHVGRWAELDGLVEAIYSRLGRVDVLVNNAGKSPLYASEAAVSEALFDSVVNLVLKGTFRLTALVGERMVAAGRGSIINVSSTGSLRPRPGMIPYVASKAGVNALTAAFAEALAPAVRVNVLMPGPFFTAVSEAWDTATLAEVERGNALGRGGRPDEIVGAALFLASDASSFTTGSIVRVDGGIR